MPKQYPLTFPSKSNACRRCGLEVSWGKHDYNGKMKWIPLNADGLPHWETCKSSVRANWTKEQLEQQIARHPNFVTGQHNVIVETDEVPW